MPKFHLHKNRADFKIIFAYPNDFRDLEALLNKIVNNLLGHFNCNLAAKLLSRKSCTASNAFNSNTKFFGKRV